MSGVDKPKRFLMDPINGFFSNAPRRLLEIRRIMDPLSWSQLTITLTTFLLFMIIPIFAMVYSAFVDEFGRPSLSWFNLIFSSPFFFTNPLGPLTTKSVFQVATTVHPLDTLIIEGIDCGVFFNSLFVALLTTVFSTILGVALAFIMARYEFFGKTFFKTALIIPLLSSPFVGAIGIKKMIGPWGVLNLLFYDTLHVLPMRIVLKGLAAVIFVQVLHFFALVYINAYTAFINIDPTLEEQAENMGSRGFRLFRTVTLPLALPGIQAGAVLTFILSIEDLGTPIVFHDNPQAIKLLTYQVFEKIFAPTGEIGPLAPALSIILLIMAMTGFLLIRKYVGLRRYAMISKGGTWHPRSTIAKPWQTTLFYIFMIIVLGFALIPHTGVVLLSVAKSWGATILPTEMTLENYGVLFSDPGIGGSVYNSLLYSFVATMVIIVLGTGAAYLIARKNIPGMGTLDVLVTMPVAIPGIVIAVGYFLTFLPTPLSPLINPIPLIILSYTIRKIPFTIRAAFAGLQQTHETLEEASLNLGANRVTTFFRIVVPLIVINILAGGMLSFVYSMSEVSTSLILGGVKPETAPLTWKMKDVLWQVAAGPYPAAVLGVLLMVAQIIIITVVNYVLKQRAAIMTGL